MCRRTQLPSRPSPLLWLSWLVIITLGVSSCRGKTAVKAAAASHTQEVKAPPAYRGGQYCVPGKATKYRAAEFECEHHHLVRR
jgi:hypothetical protein